MTFLKMVLALFARNTTTGVTEPVDKTNDGRHALHVADQHQQGLTDAELRATDVGVDTGLTQPLTEAQLRAAPVEVEDQHDQPLTEAQLTAAALAKEVTLQGTNASLGTDGAAAPSIPGTGVRGWLRSIYDRLFSTLSVNARDAQNEQTTSLGADEVFTGAYTRIDSYGSVEVLYASQNPLASVQLEWSSDGVTPLSPPFSPQTLSQRVVSGYNVVYHVISGRQTAPYYRLKVTNGATPQGAYPSFISVTWLNRDQYNGAFDFLDAPLTNLTRALMVRIGSAGTVKSTANSTATPLTAGATFTGTSEPVLAYNQINVKVYAEPSGAKASLFLEFSDDGTNWDISIPNVVRIPTLVIPLPLINVGAHFRLRYLNDGGAAAISALGLYETAGTPTAQTVFRLQTYLLPTPTKELVRTLDQHVQASDPITLVRSIDSGRQPDGDFVNAKADGTVFTETTPLGAAGVFTSGWFGTDGWRSIELYIATDQVSGSQGIEVHFTEDVEVAVPNVRPGPKRTFTAADVVNGFAVFRFAVALNGFRIKYTNGGTVQGAFMMQCNVHVTNVELPQAPMETEVNTTNNMVMTRGALLAANPTGVYASILRSVLGGLRIAVLEHEAETPIKSLVGWQVNQANVGTSAVQIVGSPLAGRRSVALKALGGNNAKVYVGKSGVTTGSGFELSSSEFVVMELDDTAAGIFAIAASGTQRVCWLEVGT